MSVRLLLISLSMLFVGFEQSCSAQSADASQPPVLRAMSWNIWHGGREDGEQVGPERVVEVIRDSEADVVAMQETYGSGEKISKSLGFQFVGRGTNVSIHSRFPILEDISVGDEFNCVGALIELPGQRRLAFYSVWLPYGDDIWIPETRKQSTNEQMRAACMPSAEKLRGIMDAIRQRLDERKYDDVSVVVAGDFNSMSHLDWNDVGIDQYKRVIDWDTSRLMTDADFRDSYRESNPTIDRKADATWSPRFPEQEQERIDFVYYKSGTMRAVESRNIREHREQFPSDHAAVLSTFRFDRPTATQSLETQVATYNIRRGLGSDGRSDLERTAKAIGDLRADVIGLQEVDLNTRRSGRVNQPHELGRRLYMHAAFGEFMDLQDGKYGMAILSRFPIQSVEKLKLPVGNEPRIALIANVLLPNNQRVKVVNVHFDWVDDDAYRFAQASRLQAYLQQLTDPFVLVGDFNDRPGSRTLELFRQITNEAIKPENDRKTWPADEPTMEIDFVFASSTGKWKVKEATVVPESVASDHRPVTANLEWRPAADQRATE